MTRPDRRRFAALLAGLLVVVGHLTLLGLHVRDRQITDTLLRVEAAIAADALSERLARGGPDAGRLAMEASETLDAAVVDRLGAAGIEAIGTALVGVACLLVMLAMVRRHRSMRGSALAVLLASLAMAQVVMISADGGRVAGEDQRRLLLVEGLIGAALGPAGGPGDREAAAGMEALAAALPSILRWEIRTPTGAVVGQGERALRVLEVAGPWHLRPIVGGGAVPVHLVDLGLSFGRVVDPTRQLVNVGRAFALALLVGLMAVALAKGRGRVADRAALLVSQTATACGAGAGVAAASLVGGSLAAILSGAAGAGFGLALVGLGADGRPWRGHGLGWALAGLLAAGSAMAGLAAAQPLAVAMALGLAAASSLGLAAVVAAFAIRTAMGSTEAAPSRPAGDTMAVACGWLCGVLTAATTGVADGPVDAAAMTLGLSAIGAVCLLLLERDRTGPLRRLVAELSTGMPAAQVLPAPPWPFVLVAGLGAALALTVPAAAIPGLVAGSAWPMLSTARPAAVGPRTAVAWALLAAAAVISGLVLAEASTLAPLAAGGVTGFIAGRLAARGRRAGPPSVPAWRGRPMRQSLLKTALVVAAAGVAGALVLVLSQLV